MSTPEPEILEDYAFDAPARGANDWTAYADGKPRRVVQGEHFTIKPENYVRNLRKWAREHEHDVTVAHERPENPDADDATYAIVFRLVPQTPRDEPPAPEGDDTADSTGEAPDDATGDADGDEDDDERGDDPAAATDGDDGDDQGDATDLDADAPGGDEHAPDDATPETGPAFTDPAAAGSRPAVSGPPADHRDDGGEHHRRGFLGGGRR